MIWYPRYVNDYAGDTRGLSLMEHGVYTLLLDELYKKETYIEPSRVPRICSAVTDEEKKACEFVVQRYFKLTPQGLTHERFEKELAIRQSRIKASRENGLRGGRPKAEEPNGNLGHNLEANLEANLDLNPEKSYSQSHTQKHVKHVEEQEAEQEEPRQEDDSDSTLSVDGSADSAFKRCRRIFREKAGKSPGTLGSKAMEWEGLFSQVGEEKLVAAWETWIREQSREWLRKMFHPPSYFLKNKDEWLEAIEMKEQVEKPAFDVTSFYVDDGETPEQRKKRYEERARKATAALTGSGEVSPGSGTS